MKEYLEIIHGWAYEQASHFVPLRGINFVSCEYTLAFVSMLVCDSNSCLMFWTSADNVIRIVLGL